MAFSCNKYQKPTNIKLEYRLDGVKKPHFECIHCRFEIIIGIDEECLHDYIKKLSLKKLHYYLFKNLNEKLNKRNLSDLLKNRL